MCCESKTELSQLQESAPESNSPLLWTSERKRDRGCSGDAAIAEGRIFKEKQMGDEEGRQVRDDKSKSFIDYNQVVEWETVTTCM